MPRNATAMPASLPLTRPSHPVRKRGIRRSCRLLAGMLALVTPGLPAVADEASAHDFAFERWLRTTFFAGYQPAGDPSRWSVPPEINQQHGGMAVNLRMAKYGGAIALGDALRQYEIVEPFILIVGFWKPAGARKRIVNIIAPEISPERWRELWAPVTLADLLKFEDLIRDPGRTIEETRRLALRMKNAPPFSQAIIQVTPRIGNDGQRRLQCSIRFADVFAHLAPAADRAEQTAPALWGVPIPDAAEPEPRASQQAP